MFQLPPHLRPTTFDASRIEHDRACPSCGYNVRGLRVGDRCPECATPITGGAVARSDTLGSAPVEYLHQFARGSMLMGVAAAPFFGLLLLAAFLGRGGGSLLLGATALAAICSIAWAIGVQLATAPRPAHEDSPRAAEESWSVLRMITRVSQWAFVVSQLCWAGAAQITVSVGGLNPAAKLLFGMGLLFAAVGAVGLCFLLAYMIRIAHWADDTELVDRLKLIPALLAISFFILLIASVVGPQLGGGIISFMLVPIAGVSLLTLMYSVWVTASTCWRFGSLGFWSLENRKTALSSDQRRSARIVKRIDDGLAKPKGTSSAPPPPPPKIGPQGNYLPKAGSFEPLDIVEPGKPQS